MRMSPLASLALDLVAALARVARPYLEALL